MKNIQDSQVISNYLERIFPNPKCFLNYEKDYELVIAVMLSAQTTDNSVNRVTSVLFKQYNSLIALAQADVNDIKKCISSLGLAETKSKNCKGIAEILIKKFNGKVPNKKEDLLTLPGVGNKTANVVLAELFRIPTFPVDTHINRISKRLSIADDKDSVETVEKKLKKYFPEEKYIDLHHQIIMFGREICNARNPKCDICELKNCCKFFKASSRASK